MKRHGTEPNLLGTKLAQSPLYVHVIIERDGGALRERVKTDAKGLSTLVLIKSNSIACPCWHWVMVR